MTAFHIIIPARYHSTRLPGKLLLDVHGQSVLERVYRQALRANAASVTIATDHPTVYAQACAFGASVVMTKAEHQTGTDRLAEAIIHKNFADDDLIVNVQGDEPFIPPQLIQQVAHALATSTAPVATLCWPINDPEDFQNPNVVKVVRNKNNQALYFSRSPIPFRRDKSTTLAHIFRHIGLYAYRCGFLKEFVNWPVCELEAVEVLEQLRILWHGSAIQVEEASVAPQQDINTAEDLEKARAACL